ncbi:MAG: hypothetical protein LBO63_04295 [Oscillospiraceae bacterium]|nr:hypothetical protein [Oscillospiraceae bacterium]
MKSKKIILITIIFMIATGFIVGIIYIIQPGLFQRKSAATTDNYDPELLSRYQPVTDTIRTSTLSHTETITANILAGISELYTETIYISNITNDNFQLYKEKQEYLVPDEALYNLNGKEKTISYNAMVTDIRYEQHGKTKNAVVTLLNFDLLTIELQVKTEVFEKLTYDTVVRVYFKGKEYPATIARLGYEIMNDKISVSVKTEENLLPGTEVKVEFVLETIFDGMFLWANAVYQDGEAAYVDIQTQDEVNAGLLTGTPRRIKLGQRLEYIENGNTFYFYEVIAGLKPGEHIIWMEYLESSNEGTQIKEIIKNAKFD